VHVPGLCSYCSGLVVDAPEQYRAITGPINGLETIARVRDAVESGGLVLLKADCPLDRTADIWRAETMYTMAHFLRCTRCGSYIFFGLAVRGWPIYREADRDEIEHWPWQPSELSVDNLTG
jgi:hypothetical protein